MTGQEQAIWCAVFAAALVTSRDAADGASVDRAAKTADFAVADLARYRRTQDQREAVTPVETATLTMADAKAAMDEAELEMLTRPAKPAAKGRTT